MGVRLYPLKSRDQVARRLGPERAAVDGLPDAAVVCEVWDSGPGIPEAHKEKVFERFHRVDEARRGDQSTGIGLAITRSIVEGHGGAVWVEDENGGGSRFVLLLESSTAEGAGDAQSTAVAHG
jgi:signal transduction histidine kinase